MDARIHQIGTALGLISLLSGLGIAGRDFLATAQSPQQSTSVNPVIPKAGEFKSTQLKDGSKWGLIKMWSYKFDPSLPPSTDLEVVKNAIATGEFSGFILEDESKPPVWGWMLVREGGDYKLKPVTDQTARNNKELFDKFRDKNKEGKPS